MLLNIHKRHLLNNITKHIVLIIIIADYECEKLETTQFSVTDWLAAMFCFPKS